MISVIIPTYNRADTIKRAIESVIIQGEIVTEIIVVDDGSTDKTKDIIECINDTRIKYINNDKQMGACASRNVGIQNSSNEIIAFQDSDDEWHSNKLSIQLPYILEKNYDVVCCGYNQIKDKNNIYIGKVVNDNQIYSELLKGNFIGTPTIIGKKECFLSTRFDDSIPRFQDWEIMIRISKSYKVKFINESLVNAYLQSDSITRNNKNAIIALEIIMKRNISDFNNKLESIYLRRMGVYSLYTKEVELNYFIKAYSKHKNLKTFIDYLFAKCNANKFLKKIHNI